MSDEMGTRIKATGQNAHQEGGSDTRSHTRDAGMSKRVQVSLTFTAATGRVTGANGTFANFVPQDPVLIQGTNLNNGAFEIVSTDAVNAAFLRLDPPPKDEGPIVCIVRTP
jgi:hypothetical protein